LGGVLTLRDGGSRQQQLLLVRPRVASQNKSFSVSQKITNTRWSKKAQRRRITQNKKPHFTQLSQTSKSNLFQPLTKFEFSS
jgi:hypothetical protein